MNKRGLAEQGVLYALVMVLTTIASTGVMFSSATPVGSIFLTATSATVLHSQQPKVVKDFRFRKAVGMCQETGNQDCQTMVASWSDEDILNYIRDDEPAQVRTNGGNFVGGYMNP